MPDETGFEEIEKIFTELRKYIADHRAKKLLCIIVRRDTIEIVRIVARPMVIPWPGSAPTSGLKWTFNGYHKEKVVPFSCVLSSEQCGELNGKLEREFAAVWAKHNKTVTQEEFEELLAEACEQTVETDYRPAEGIPEDYYAG